MKTFSLGLFLIAAIIIASLLGNSSMTDSTKGIFITGTILIINCVMFLGVLCKDR